MAKLQQREDSTTFTLDLDITIDENNLVEEWRRQAGLMLRYGILLADAQQAEDEARANLAVVVAELDGDIRAYPDRFGIEKLTESALSSVVVVQREHVVATTKLNKARHKARVLKAAVDALSHRKSALSGMTDLFLRQWYADPKSEAQPSELKTAARSGPPSVKSVRRVVRRRGEY